MDSPLIAVAMLGAGRGSRRAHAASRPVGRRWAQRLLGWINGAWLRSRP